MDRTLEQEGMADDALLESQFWGAWETALAESADKVIVAPFAEGPWCPPLVHFLPQFHGMWTDRERTHIGGCPLCQKTLSHAWRAAGKCPSVWQVFQYWYLGREFELAGALKLHVRRDGCRRCRLLMCSSWLVGVAELFENGKQSWEQLRDWLSPAFCLLAPAFVPIPVGADKFDDGCTPFIKSETNSDGSAGVTVEVSRTGHLELTVESTTTDFQQVLVIGAETATLTPLAQSESGSRAVDLESSQEEQLLVLVPRL